MSLAGLPSLPGQEATEAVRPSTAGANAAGDLENLIQTVDDAEMVYLAANREERGELWKTYESLNTASIPKVVELVTNDPRSPLALPALEWVVTNRQVVAGKPELQPYRVRAIELLQENGYARDPAIGRVCWGLGRKGDWLEPTTATLLKEVIAHNPDHNARGQATQALALLVKAKAELLGRYENAPWSFQGEWLQIIADEADQTNAQAAIEEAGRLFENVGREFAECPDEGNSDATLGERAESELYEIKHLWPGRTAPEIEGEDIDGILMRLSDYRGRVVVLNFWGKWCGPCMAMIPYERAMAERLAEAPFALVGVNSDRDRLVARRTVEQENMTWRSFWSGAEGTSGLIPTTWNVRGWPTTYVIDAQGTIRLKTTGYSGEFGDRLLNETVDRLLIELQQSPDDGQ